MRLGLASLSRAAARRVAAASCVCAAAAALASSPSSALTFLRKSAASRVWSFSRVAARRGGASRSRCRLLGRPPRPRGAPWEHLRGGRRGEVAFEGGGAAGRGASWRPSSSWSSPRPRARLQRRVGGELALERAHLPTQARGLLRPRVRVALEGEGAARGARRGRATPRRSRRSPSRGAPSAASGGGRRGDVALEGGDAPAQRASLRLGLGVRLGGGAAVLVRGPAVGVRPGARRASAARRSRSCASAARRAWRLRLRSPRRRARPRARRGGP